MSKKSINIHLVDDSEVEIEGHEVLCNSFDEFNIIKISRNGLEAVRWEENNSSDLMVVDLCMPVFDGIEVMKYIKKHKMNKKVIMYSGLVTVNILNDLIDLGIKSYVIKSECLDEQFIRALKEVYNGGTYFSEYVRGVLDEVKPEIKPVQKINISEKVLSKQETEVLNVILNNSQSTLEEINIDNEKKNNVMRRIRDKYNVRNNVSLVVKLLKR